MEKKRIIYRKSLLSLLLTAMFLTGIAWIGPKAHAGVLDLMDPATKLTGYYTQVPGGEIYVEKVDKVSYLFLPSEADTEHIVLYPPAGDGNERTVFFSVNGVEKESLDLREASLSEGKYSVEVKVRDAGGSLKDSFDLKIMKGSGIGTVYYTSDDKKSKGRSWIEEAKSNEGSGKAIVFDAAGNNLTKDEKNQVVTDFHGRGASSWLLAKKSYQIKFDKKISLVDGCGKEKKWVLLAQYVDYIRMNDKIAKDIAYLTSRNFSPRETWVNFYYDGEYRGVYMLSEKNEIKNSRIDIHDMEDVYEAQDPGYGEDVRVREAVNQYGNTYLYQEGLTGPEEPGGFLLELDNLDEANGFHFKAKGDRTINLKSPQLGSQEAVRYISEYFQEFCDAVYAKDENGVNTGRNPRTGLYYYDYCDMDSLVDTYLANTVCNTRDAFVKSQYFYKDKGGKMIAGPVWDIDQGFGFGSEFDISPLQDLMAGRIITGELIKIPTFRDKVKERYQQVYAPVLESLISTGELTPTWERSYLTIRDDLAMDHVMWTVKLKSGKLFDTWADSTTAEEILQTRIDWLAEHKAYLDAYFEVPSDDDSESSSNENEEGSNGSSKSADKKRSDQKQTDQKQTASKASQTTVTISSKTVTAADVKAACSRAKASRAATTTIILGRKVKTIRKNAFRGTKIRTIIVKTKKLKKKSVKGSLKGSKVRTVKVSVGSNKANKRYTKAYKKIFTKKNAGKKVTVKRIGG